MCDCGNRFWDAKIPYESGQGASWCSGQIQRRLKAGSMFSTWDCYRRNGIQDQTPCEVRVGIPPRYLKFFPNYQCRQHSEFYHKSY